jgi:hypothetical protein
MHTNADKPQLPDMHTNDSSSEAGEDRFPYICNPWMTQTQAQTNSKPAQADKTTAAHALWPAATPSKPA